jgi:ABC transport system ATP-binding/permease protein
MNLVTITNLSKGFGDRQLLDEANLLINQGDRIGLIGANGSGKTTLLRLIAGLEPADGGSITVWGGVRIHYLPQEPELQEELTVLDYVFGGDAPQLRLLRAYRAASSRLASEPQTPELEAEWAALSDEMARTGGWAAEANAKSILTRLGVEGFDTPLAHLSGGQAKRVALARVLIDPADLLMLDEPTNHIDADTIDWLESYLTTVPGALLMVTHDRYFLDRVVNGIVELDRRQLVSYPGNYQKYLERRTERHERLAAAERKRQNLLRRELAWLQRGAMARSTKQKARKQRVLELQRLSHDLGESQVAMALAGRRLGKKVLEARGLSKRYGPDQVFGHADLDLVGGDRLGIVGPNGVGKSTLLDILAGITEPDAGHVAWGPTVHLAYYDQLNRGLDLSKRVIDFITDKAPLIRTDEGYRVEAAQMLEWFLFSRRQQQTYISSLSGGERRRLYLLWVLAHRPNVLFLDEPTNDLDIQTLNVLEEYLDHFQGCLIAVSHDRYFLDRNVDYLLTFEEDGLSGRYPAPFENFRKASRERAAAEKAGQEARTAPGGRRPAKERTGAGQAAPERTLTWKESRELEGLETLIARLEDEKRGLAEAINEAGGDYQRLEALAGQLEGIEARLDEKMKRWLELSEIAQGQ